MGEPLGERYVKSLWFEQINSGTSGTLTPPAQAEIVLDQWSAGVDALASTIASGIPAFVSPVTSGGVIVTATLDSSGNWALSGTPSAYPVAIVYAYQVKFKFFDYTKQLGGYELIPAAGGVFTDVASFGGRLSSADTTVQKSLDTLDDHAHSGTYLTPTEHTNIGDGSPHHAAISLDTQVETIFSLSTQQITLDSQNPNIVFAGPATGPTAADPTFRSLVVADIPSGVDHGGLAGLVDDDHPHYQLRCGVSARTATFSYSSGVFTATYVSPYNVWTNGVKWPITTTRTADLASNNTLYYVYFDTDGVMKASTTEWDLTGNVAPFALVFRVSSSLAAMGDERHAPDRNRGLHIWAHESIGARYDSLHGGLVGTFGTTTFSITTGAIWDEDLVQEVTGTKTTCRRWSRIAGAAAMTFVDGATVLYSLNGTNIQYDNAGTLTDASSNKYVCHYVFATNDVTVPIYSLIGQAQHSTVADAQNEAVPAFAGLTTIEWKLLYKVIYRNTGNPPTYISALDYRNVVGVPISFVPTSHGSLTGLDADDHEQYILVAGTRAFTGDQALGTHKFTGLSVPVNAGDSIRATAKITEALLESATDLKHAAVTLATAGDTLLGLSGQALDLDTQAANLGFFGPVSGAAAAPTFRAMVNADLPVVFKQRVWFGA